MFCYSFGDLSCGNLTQHMLCQTNTSVVFFWGVFLTSFPFGFFLSRCALFPIFSFLLHFVCSCLFSWSLVVLTYWTWAMGSGDNQCFCVSWTNMLSPQQHPVYETMLFSFCGLWPVDLPIWPLVSVLLEELSLAEQVRRIKDIEAIETDSFVPQAFKSSRDATKVHLSLSPSLFFLPSVSYLYILLFDFLSPSYVAFVCRWNDSH